MRSDALLGALVVMIVVLLTAGLRRPAAQGAGRTRDRTVQLDDGERVRMMLVASRRTAGG